MTIITEITPGEGATVFGENLALPGMTGQAPSIDPCGVSATFQDLPVEISFASATQLLARFPDELEAGPGDLVVTVGEASSEPYSLTVIELSPRLLTTSGSEFGAFQIANGGIVTADEPAVEGAMILAYANGLGATAASEVQTGRIGNTSDRTDG